VKRYFASIIILFLIMVTNLFCFVAEPMKGEHKSHQHHEVAGKDIQLSGKVEHGVRVIEVKASRYKFDPDPIVVNLGEKVQLVVTSTDVAHGIAIPEFNVNLSIPAGKTKHVEFVADKQGTFYAYCSVYCGPGHSSMHASLIILK